MEGSSVNTYKLVNERGEAVLCKFSFEPKLGIVNSSSEQAARDSSEDVGHATRDLYEAIERRRVSRSGKCACRSWRTASTPKLELDPLDDTKRWPEDKFPLLPVGRLDCSIAILENVFARETEQAAFGTGVLVEGASTARSKQMLQGRTLSYSDTQRYRVGPNYLQLPINAPVNSIATNQRDGQMAYDGRHRRRESARELRAKHDGWIERSRAPVVTTISTSKDISGAIRRRRRQMTISKPASAIARSRTGSARI